jgi:hypothetical protein
MTIVPQSDFSQGRHQRGAIKHGPAVILHMCDFDPAGA